MKRHIGFLLIPLMLVAGGCASVRPGASAAKGWTGPLDAVGISSCVESYAAPRDWRVHVISNAPAAAVAPEMTLADLKGPGCILSLKSGNPSGMLNVSVDDAPAFQVRYPNLFGGFIPPFTAPLAGEAPAADYSYVPIPFSRHCVITLQGAEEAPIYQITYAEFKPDAPIAPFSIALEGSDNVYFADWKEDVENGEKVRFVDRAHEKYHTTSSQIWPHKDERVYAIEGPGVITELEMSINAKDQDILRKVWIELYWDGRPEPAVVAPAALFFGAASTSAPDFHSVAFGKAGTHFWCRCPMPFASGAQLRVVNTSDSKIDFSYGLTWRPGAPQGGLYFHARANQSAVGASMPFEFATLQGKGHLLGRRVALQDAGQFHFAAVNTVVTADGEALAFTGNLTASARPGDAEIAKARPEAGGVTDAAGAISDAVPFQQSLTCAVPAPATGAPADCGYSYVTFWYQTEPAGAPWTIPDYAPRASK